MHVLELKVPPVGVLLVTAGLMWFVAGIVPALEFVLPAREFVAMIFAVAGLSAVEDALAIGGVYKTQSLPFIPAAIKRWPRPRASS